MRDFTRKQAIFIDELIDKMHARVQELSSMIIHAYAPTLWLDFLNSDPEKSEEMWGVYYEFVRFMKAIQGKHFCSKDIMGMKLMSKMEFLETYPTDLQDNAQRLHGGIKQVIDEGRGDVIEHLTRDIVAAVKKNTPAQEEEAEKAEKMITGGVILPPVSFTVLFQLPEEDNPPWRSTDVTLYTPSATRRDFWLAIIYSGAITLSTSMRDDKIIVRRCAAPDCQKYFRPVPHAHDRQKYHSPTCRSRHRMQERRRQEKNLQAT